jgi:hypothetical protein
MRAFNQTTLAVQTFSDMQFERHTHWCVNFVTQKKIELFRRRTVGDSHDGRL